MHADECLNLLVAYIRHYPRDLHIFRTIVDNWHAHHRGGPFLSKNGTPKWFNKPKPTDARLKLMDFVSAGAEAVLEGHSDQRLIVDHAVPLCHIHSRLLELPKDLEVFESFLLVTYKLGVLTKEEDDTLNENKLRHVMPKDWDGRNPFARYESVGIIRAL